MISMPKNLVKVCPVCGSRKVSNPIVSSIGNPYYACGNCGYHSTLFPEVNRKEAEKLEKDSGLRKERFKKYLKGKKVKGPSTIIIFFSLIALILIFAMWVSLAAGKPINPIGSFIDMVGPEITLITIIVIAILFLYYILKPKH